LIEEKYIDAAIEALENKDENQEFLKEETLLEYLQSDTFSAFSEDERQLFFFCFEVIFISHKLSQGVYPEFDLDTFVESEEKNWQLREASNNWSEAVDVFFENYKEEDLLAFLEDSLVELEEDDISEIAKEFIFISCKSYIDSILIV